MFTRTKRAGRKKRGSNADASTYSGSTLDPPSTQSGVGTVIRSDMTDDRSTMSDLTPIKSTLTTPLRCRHMGRSLNTPPAKNNGSCNGGASGGSRKISIISPLSGARISLPSRVIPYKNEDEPTI